MDRVRAREAEVGGVPSLGTLIAPLLSGADCGAGCPCPTRVVQLVSGKRLVDAERAWASESTLTGRPASRPVGDRQ